MGKSYRVLAESVRDPDDGGYIHKCGTFVMGKTVHLSVRNPLLPLAGSGAVITEVVPYCPSCEVEPQAFGAILEAETPTAQEEKILRRMQDQP
jgi:hypothetical protein